jgi:hypothetical protein
MRYTRLEVLRAEPKTRLSRPTSPSPLGRKLRVSTARASNDFVPIVAVSSLLIFSSKAEGRLATADTPQHNAPSPKLGSGSDSAISRSQVRGGAYLSMTRLITEITLPYHLITVRVSYFSVSYFSHLRFPWCTCQLNRRAMLPLNPFARPRPSSPNPSTAIRAGVLARRRAPFI